MVKVVFLKDEDLDGQRMGYGFLVNRGECLEMCEESLEGARKAFEFLGVEHEVKNLLTTDGLTKKSAEWVLRQL